MGWRAVSPHAGDEGGDDGGGGGDDDDGQWEGRGIRRRMGVVWGVKVVKIVRREGDGWKCMRLGHMYVY